MFAFIVSNSGFLIHLWLVILDLRISCTIRQLIPLDQISLADALGDSLFALTQLYIEILLYIKSVYRHLGIYIFLVPALIVLGRKIQMGIPFGDYSLLPLVRGITSDGILVGISPQVPRN